MPADVVNLRRVRKSKERATRDSRAAAQRSLFGRTKAEKAKEARERERALRNIDAHRRDKD